MECRADIEFLSGYNDNYTGMHVKLTLSNIPANLKCLVSDAFSKGIVGMSSGMGPESRHDNISFISKGAVTVVNTELESFELSVALSKLRVENGELRKRIAELEDPSVSE